MDNTDFTKIYSILGVFQDDGWEATRAAYKKLIKRWHPDHFQDPAHRKLAEEKSKQINQAYQKLSEYYDKYGTLPPDHGTATNPIDPPQEHGSYEHSHDHGFASAQPAQPGARRSYIPVIVLGIMVALGYSLWEPEIQTENPSEHSEIRLEEHITEKNLDGPENIPHENRIIYTAKGSSVSENYKTAFDVDNTAPSNQLTSIKKGSSKGEVLIVQGPPDRQTDTAWDYGASRIYFQAGHVSGWYENPMNPLNITR